MSSTLETSPPYLFFNNMTLIDTGNKSPPFLEYLIHGGCFDQCSQINFMSVSTFLFAITVGRGVTVQSFSTLSDRLIGSQCKNQLHRSR